MTWGSKYGYSFQGGNEVYGMGLVRSSSFGRKRVALTSNDVMDIHCFDNTPLKRQCSFEASPLTSDKSRLEELPQDVLIKIVCGVDHDDLKSLFFVSKPIREATVIAKDSHFVYRTPKKTLRFLSAVDMEGLSKFSEIERAPMRIQKSRWNSKKLSDVSVALFTGEDEEKKWSRRDLFMELKFV